MSAAREAIQFANKLLDEGRELEAIRTLEASLAGNNDDIPVLQLLGKIYLRTNQPRDAIRTLSLALDLMGASKPTSHPLDFDQNLTCVDLEYVDQSESAAMTPSTSLRARGITSELQMTGLSAKNGAGEEFSRPGDDRREVFVSPASIADSFSGEPAIGFSGADSDSRPPHDVTSDRTDSHADVSKEERERDLFSGAGSVLELNSLLLGATSSLDEIISDESASIRLSPEGGLLLSSDPVEHDLDKITNPPAYRIVDDVVDQFADDTPSSPSISGHSVGSESRAFEPSGDRDEERLAQGGELTPALDDGLLDVIELEEVEDWEQEGSDLSILDEAAALYDVASESEVADSESDDIRVFASGLTRRERARQIAIQCLLKWGWPTSALSLLTDIFDQHGWSACKTAIEREAEHGLSPEELEVTFGIRGIWTANERYWMSFDQGETTSPRFSGLTWRLAVLICRAFRGVPAIEEVEFFIEDQFEIWYSDRRLRRQFDAFIKYLYYRIAGGAHLLDGDCREDFSGGDPLWWDDASDVGETDIRLYEQEALLLHHGIRIREIASSYAPKNISDDRPEWLEARPPRGRYIAAAKADECEGKDIEELLDQPEEDEEEPGGAEPVGERSAPQRVALMDLLSAIDGEIARNPSRFACLNCGAQNPKGTRECIKCKKNPHFLSFEMLARRRSRLR